MSGPTDRIDGYNPTTAVSRDTDPADDPEVFAAAAMQAQNDAADALARGEIRFDNLDGYRQELMDGFRNFLTGLGDPARDKSLGGSPAGPDFVLRFITGAEASDRWRGSDLGANIIETIPNEMTRRGWRLDVQPDEDEDLAARVASGRAPVADMLRQLHRRAVAHGDTAGALVLRRAMDDWPVPPTASPPHKPTVLPEASSDNTAIIEKMAALKRRLHAREVMREALQYQRAYGGGAVFLGVDDGEPDLTRPLDLDRVQSVRHLTAYRGGWDGELIAWRWYNDPRKPKFGEPAVYMLRNLGVPIASPAAPGETRPPPPIPAGPTGSLIFYVHESRLLLFPGQPVSRLARVQMRGWSDSIFSRVDEVLAQYAQTWSGITVLMQEYSLPVMSMEGLSALLASKNKEQQGQMANRVQAMSMAMSIARMRLIDTKEKLERLSVPMGGMADVLREFALRLAAAAGMPVSMLFGQVQGGLGDAAKGDIRFFYDRIEGRQEDELLPQVEKLERLLLRSKDGPTGGKEPKRWTATMNPIWQMTDAEKADYRNKIAQTDKIYVDMGGATPEEVIATRYGGSDYNDGPIVLDLEGRRRMAVAPRPAAPAPGAKPPSVPAGPVAAPVGAKPAAPPNGTPAPSPPAPVAKPAAS